MKCLKILILLLFFISCSKDNCSSNLDFKLDYHLFKSIDKEENSYCDLVNNSLNSDIDAIKLLSTVSVDDFASYQHGAVLIEVIKKISEENYIKIFKELTEKEKQNILAYIEAGIDFNESSNLKKYKKIQLEFPLLFSEK